ncbi:MAG: ABC transporter ATP-binding protein [candidate division Zixibacteria bacterium]|nr:ABC transporter ATP-binding protein [candidate division Zixibacteria bacterium]
MNSSRIDAQESENVVLETKNLTRNFTTAGGQLEVLRGIDFQVNQGEFASITGPSGVGKSTLLHILGGLDRPSSGEVIVCGQRVDRMGDAELSRYRNKNIGFVFQFHYLLEEFSALENVMMPLLVGGESRNKSMKQAVELLEEVGLGERATHRPAQLSGGECQRVAVARAIVGRPRLLIADEPTGDLDVDAAESLHDLFMRLNSSLEMTIIVATHDLSLAGRAGKRFTMTAGRLIEKKVMET